MASYDITLKRTEPVADGTLALYFDKPDGFAFRAGQCVRLVLKDPPETDDEGNGRMLSLASAPAESELMVATRLRDTAFKRVLGGLKPGAVLTLKGPYGDFVLPAEGDAPVVFVTGGIGITPVRSMLLQALDEGDNRAITLFYANRSLGDAAFLYELQQACAGRSNYELVTILTQDPGWQGEKGRLDEAMLRRHVMDLTAPLYYLDGPPGLVSAMKSVLAGAGVPEDRVRTEEFAGY
ncbi:FAD-dependent oxidoreductase [Oceanimonas sp. CHS3-5]|uniref:ferredoxin--NADP reductase n=1 Tax=Oceanimonas sp. CHS3-5 TaxID=3068186 RepID=UPI00273E906D|nr:FAD-dependent oxidoreductase [Oceanimonas sp. CHS3-5]MDP5293273.1 FAD-dependent oxidoreductase [Oceanimonas sp. CHS3-5]